MTEFTEEKKKPGRPPKRDGIGSNRISYAERNKLSVQNRDDGFNYRVVNTDDEKWQGRIENMMARGYTVCHEGEILGDSRGTEASQVGSVIGKPVGNGVRGVLMKIPKEFYEEDQAAKQAEVDHSEMGMVADELRNAEGMYGEGLKVSDNRGTRLETKVRQ